MCTPDTVEKMRQDWLAGMTYRQISKKYGISLGSISKYAQSWRSERDEQVSEHTLADTGESYKRFLQTLESAEKYYQQAFEKGDFRQETASSAVAALERLAAIRGFITRDDEKSDDGVTVVIGGDWDS